MKRTCATVGMQVELICHVEKSAGLTCYAATDLRRSLFPLDLENVVDLLTSWRFWSLHVSHCLSNRALGPKHH